MSEGLGDAEPACRLYLITPNELFTGVLDLEAFAGQLATANTSSPVKVPEGITPAQERSMLLAIANRPMDTNTTFTTGGDVSRFQRRTVPAKAGGSDQLAQAMAGVGKNIAQAVTGQPAVPTGPVVRVARGNEITVVPVGAR